MIIKHRDKILAKIRNNQLSEKRMYELIKIVESDMEMEEISSDIIWGQIKAPEDIQTTPTDPDNVLYKDKEFEKLRKNVYAIKFIEEEGKYYVNYPLGIKVKKDWVNLINIPDTKVFKNGTKYS